MSKSGQGARTFRKQAERAARQERSIQRKIDRKTKSKGRPGRQSLVCKRERATTLRQSFHVNIFVNQGMKPTLSLRQCMKLPATAVQRSLGTWLHLLPAETPELAAR